MSSHKNITSEEWFYIQNEITYKEDILEEFEFIKYDFNTTFDNIMMSDFFIYACDFYIYDILGSTGEYYLKFVEQKNTGKPFGEMIKLTILKDFYV